MQFTTIILTSLLASMVSAAPTTPTIPKECTLTTLKTLSCFFTSPHPGAYPIVPSSLPSTCKTSPDNARHMSCHLPSAPSFAKRSTTSASEDVDAYSFSLTCDPTGCQTHGLERRTAQSPSTRPDTPAAPAAVENSTFPSDVGSGGSEKEAYGFSIETTPSDKEAYGFSIDIQWKRDLEMGKRQLSAVPTVVAPVGATDAPGAVVARPRPGELEAYSFSIDIDW